MQYDRILQQYLDHEHDYADINHVHDLSGIENKVVEQDSKLKKHTDNKNNPHEVTAKQVGNDKPIWNAEKIKGIKIDDTNKRAGWGLVYNGKEYEYMPLLESKLYDHNELTNYSLDEHAKLDDVAISKKRIWSSAKTSKEIASLNKQLNDKLKKSIEKINISYEELKNEPIVMFDCGRFEDRAVTMDSLNFGTF